VGRERHHTTSAEINVNATSLKIQDFDDPGFNPFNTFDDSFGRHIDSPYPRLAELRAQARVHPQEYKVLFGLPADLTTLDMPHFSVLSYELVYQVYANPQIYSNRIFERMLGPSFGRTVVTMDAPEHTRYRRIFQKAFMPNVIASWGDNLVQPVVDDLMAGFVGRGKADLVKEFTSLYPFHIIYRQLGLPPGDQRIFHKLAVALTVTSTAVDKAIEASEKLGAYYEALTDARFEHPGEDLVSLLTRVEVEGERLPKEILVSFLRQLINAAGDTTYRATSNLLVCLLQHPEQLEAVRRDRSLIPQAIDEALRLECVVITGFRMALVDTELDGVRIPAGSAVEAVNGSANRDPARFADPDRFDIFRKTTTSRHMGFGYGPHVCIGQHLARLEITRALNAMLDRLPNLRLDPDMPPPRIYGVNMRHPEHIHVRFDA
jgi:cytochrome P450